MNGPQSTPLMGTPFQAGAIAVLCPVCGQTPAEGRALSSSFLKKELSNYYEENLPAALQTKDYQMYRCQTCTLEFAWPLAEGDAVFYDWITRRAGYYPNERWEWSEVKKRLVTVPPKPLRLLEVGCGTGRFLESLRDLSQVKAVGLETTMGSVEQCRAKGLEVHAETLAAHAKNPSRSFQSFDIIAAFHCLEHIGDPKGLMAGMLQMLAPKGRIFLSTPYSPPSFETMWFNPMSHPPHHLTRWNRAAFLALAKPFGLDIALSMPPPHGLLDRVAGAFNHAWNGPRRLQPRNQILARAMRKPRDFLAELFRQVKRERIGSTVAADVVLVQFSRMADRR